MSPAESGFLALALYRPHLEQSLQILPPAAADRLHAILDQAASSLPTSCACPPRLPSHCAYSAQRQTLRLPHLGNESITIALIAFHSLRPTPDRMRRSHP